MLELLLPVLVGALAALAMLGLVRKSRAMAESDDGRSLGTVARAWLVGSVRGLVASRVRVPRPRRPARPARAPKSANAPKSARSGRPARGRTPSAEGGEEEPPEPTWVRAAGPQVWREGKDIGCEQCAPSWELGMKTCIRCGRRLADVFTAGGR
jgi:hypothetical protein